MDVAGVAIATVISQCVSALLVVRCLIKETGAIHVDIRALKLDKDKLIKILKIGLPAGFQGMLFSLSNVVIQSSINSFGAVVVAGNSAAVNIEGFVYAAMNAFYQATISFTGQNLGAGNAERIKRTVFTGQLYVAFVGLLLGNAVYIFGQQLLGIYSTSEPVIAAGMQRLGVVAKTYAVCGMMDVMVGAMRGIGYSIVPMIVSLIGVCGFRLAWIAVLFTNEAYHTVNTVYVSYPISWAVTFLANAVFFIVFFKRISKKKEETELVL